MIQKIRNYIADFRFAKKVAKAAREADKAKAIVPDTYSRHQLENVYKLGYTDGRRDGLSVARQQASNSLKEILWQQNQNPRR